MPETYYNLLEKNNIQKYLTLFTKSFLLFVLVTIIFVPAVTLLFVFSNETYWFIFAFIIILLSIFYVTFSYFLISEHIVYYSKINKLLNKISMKDLTFQSYYFTKLEGLSTYQDIEMQTVKAVEMTSQKEVILHILSLPFFNFEENTLYRVYLHQNIIVKVVTFNA